MTQTKNGKVIFAPHYKKTDTSLNKISPLNYSKTLNPPFRPPPPPAAKISEINPPLFETLPPPLPPHLLMKGTMFHFTHKKAVSYCLLYCFVVIVFIF